MSIEDNARFVHLFALTNRNFGDDGNTIRGHIKSAKELVEQDRLDYNWKGDTRKGVMDVMLSAYKAYITAPELCEELLDCMITHGLNPLDASEEELRDMLSNEWKRNQLSDTLCRREKEGRGLRNKNGDNLLHLMVRHSLIGLENYLCVLSENKNSDEFSGAVLLARQTRANGDTLIHQLWNSRKPRNTPDSFTYLNIQITWYLMVMGVDILATNQTGETAWDALKKHEKKLWNIKSGDLEDIRALVAARLDAQTLDQNTAPALRVNKSVMRL